MSKSELYVWWLWVESETEHASVDVASARVVSAGGGDGIRCGCAYKRGQNHGLVVARQQEGVCLFVLFVL